jgi:hypothetical protein
MTTQQFLKGLLMALVGVAVSFFSSPEVDYLLMALTALCAALTYTGKNLILVLQSDSPTGSLSWVNVMSAVFIALGTGLLQAASMIIVDGVIVWEALLKITGSIVFTYVVSTWFAPPYSLKSIKMFGSIKSAA